MAASSATWRMWCAAPDAFGEVRQKRQGPTQQVRKKACLVRQPSSQRSGWPKQLPLSSIPGSSASIGPLMTVTFEHLV